MRPNPIFDINKNPVSTQLGSNDLQSPMFCHAHALQKFPQKIDNAAAGFLPLHQAVSKVSRFVPCHNSVVAPHIAT